MKTLIRALWMTVTALGVTLPATAADMSKLSLGGVYLAAATAQDDSKEPKIKETAFEQGSEIRFKGRTVLDQGLEVGFHTEMSRHGVTTAGGPKAHALADGSESRQLESVYVYVKSGYGTVAFGNPHRPAGGAGGDLESALSPITNGDDSGVSFPAFRPLQLRDDASTEAASSLGKVSYFTPRIGGVQFGVSFAPETKLSSAAVADLGLGDLTLTSPKTYEFAANYRTSINRFRLELGGSYLSASPSNVGTLSGWGAAGAVGLALPHGHGDLALAGSFRTSNCGDLVCPGGPLALNNTSSSAAWNVGLRYTTGRFALGGYFLTAHTDSSVSGLSDHGTTVFLQTALTF
jgi:hypothetical protein